MRRRAFVAGAAATFLAAPGVAWGQEMRRIAIVVPAAPVSALYKGAGVEYGAYGLLIKTLEEYGWIEGQNLVIERYSAEGNAELRPALAQAVVNSGPEVIYARGAMIDSIMAETDTIPVVTVMGQRVVDKFAESLARPGRNLTGPVNTAGTGMVAKRLQLLHEAVPTMTRLAWLSAGLRSENPVIRNFLEFADELGIAVVHWRFPYPGDVDALRRLFASLADAPVEGLMIQANTLSNDLKAMIVSMAKEAGLPTMAAGRRQYVEFGGLMYYEADIPELYRRAAWYVDQILKGADPAEMPIEQPTTYDFIINLNTARELGITLPPSIMIQATELIE